MTYQVSENVRRRNLVLSFSVVFFALTLCAWLGLSLGAVEVEFNQVIKAFFYSELEPSRDSVIITEIRLPRVILALLVGACLALCGAASQGLFRNPLADPSLIGVTAGASLGGSLSLFFGSLYFVSSTSLAEFSLVGFGAFSGGLLAVWFVFRLSTSVYGTSVVTMLLIGLGIGALASSITGFLQYLSSDSTLRQISLWQMGGLQGADMQQVMLMAILVTLVSACVWWQSSALNAMLLGESEARSLGVNIERVKLILVVCIAVGVAVCVAASGVIAFVGLVVPHICRLIIGPNHYVLLPLSALAGACLLLLSDLLARLLLSPTEIPVGLITAFIGSPLFIMLLTKSNFTSRPSSLD